MFGTRRNRRGFRGGRGVIEGKNKDTHSCPRCYGRKGETKYGKEAWFLDKAMTVGRIRIEYTGKSDGYDPDTIFSNYGPQDECYKEEYMCEETGIGSGTIYSYNHLFHTKDEALDYCYRMNERCDKDG